MGKIEKAAKLESYLKGEYSTGAKKELGMKIIFPYLRGIREKRIKNSEKENDIFPFFLKVSFFFFLIELL